MRELSGAPQQRDADDERDDDSMHGHGHCFRSCRTLAKRAIGIDTCPRGGLAPYLVAVFAISFAGLSALTLFYAVSRLDPPEAPGSPKHLDE